MTSPHFPLFEATERFLSIPLRSSEHVMTQLVIPRSLYMAMIFFLRVDIPRRFGTDFLGLTVLHSAWVPQ